MHSKANREPPCEAVRRVRELEEILGIGSRWKTVRTIPWLRQHFFLSQCAYEEIERQLVRISQEQGYECRKLDGWGPGFALAFHTQVIKVLHQQIELEPDFLAKYRGGLA